MKLSDFKKTRIVLCYPRVRFLDYDERANQFKGPTGDLITRYYDLIRNLFNVTVKLPDEESKQDVTSERMPGCFGLLQQGKADVNIYPSEMPVIDIENVTQINTTVAQSGIYMLSPYSINETLGAVALGPIDSFSSVSPEVWSLVGLTFLTFTYILLLVGYLSRVTRRTEEGLQGQSALYQVATHLIQHESCDFSGDSARFISLLMSLFAFFFITLFASMMASEKASVNTFQIYDSYEKILSNPDVQPVWIENFDDYAQYERAPVGSPRHKLWTRSRAISRSDKSRPTMIPFDVAQLGSLVEFARKKRAVFFFTNLFAKVINGIICNGIFSKVDGFDSIKDLRLKYTPDTQASTSLYVVPASRHSSPEVVAAMELLLRREVEYSLISQPDLVIETEEVLVKVLARGTIIYNVDRAKCMDFRKLPTDDPEVVPLFLTIAAKLFQWWAIGCAVSCVVFWLELRYYKLNPLRSRPGLRRSHGRHKFYSRSARPAGDSPPHNI